MNLQLLPRFVLQVAQMNKQRNAGPVAVVNRSGVDNDTSGFRRGYHLRRLSPNLSCRTGVEPSLDGDLHYDVMHGTGAQAYAPSRQIFRHNISVYFVGPGREFQPWKIRDR